jgi:hypothetical protein
MHRRWASRKKRRDMLDHFAALIFQYGCIFQSICTAMGTCQLLQSRCFSHLIFSIQLQIQFSDALDAFQSTSQNRRFAGKAQQCTDIFSPEDEVPKSRPHAGQAYRSTVFSEEDVLTKPQGIRISGGGSAHAGHLSSDFCPPAEIKSPRPHAGQACRSSVFSEEEVSEVKQGIKRSESANKSSFGTGFALPEGDSSYFQHRSRTS